MTSRVRSGGRRGEERRGEERGTDTHVRPCCPHAGWPVIYSKRGARGERERGGGGGERKGAAVRFAWWFVWPCVYTPCR